jgi:hypothetical protein
MIHGDVCWRVGWVTLLVSELVGLNYHRRYVLADNRPYRLINLRVLR